MRNMSSTNERLINLEAKVCNLEIATAKHDVKLNLISFLAGAAFISSVTTLVTLVFK